MKILFLILSLCGAARAAPIVQGTDLASALTLSGGTLTINENFIPFNGAVGSGRWGTIASGTVTNVSTLTLTGVTLSTGSKLRLHLDGWYYGIASGSPFLVVNGTNSALLYDYQPNCETNGTAGTSHAAMKYLSLIVENRTIQQNSSFTVDLNMFLVQHTSATFRGYMNTTGEDNSSNQQIGCFNTYRITRQEVLSSIQVFFAAVNEGVSTGNFDANYTLEQWQP